MASRPCSIHGQTTPNYAYYYLLWSSPCTDRDYHPRGRRLKPWGGYERNDLAMCEDTELLLRIVGDPRKIPVEEPKALFVCLTLHRWLSLCRRRRYTCEGGITNRCFSTVGTRIRPKGVFHLRIWTVFYRKSPKTNDGMNCHEGTT